MTVYQGSRYANEPLLLVKDANGKAHATVYSDIIVGRYKFVTHTVVQGDRFDTLAYSYFGDAKLWWYIASVNPEVFYPEDLQPGQVVRIPQR